MTVRAGRKSYISGIVARRAETSCIWMAPLPVGVGVTVACGAHYGGGPVLVDFLPDVVEGDASFLLAGDPDVALAGVVEAFLVTGDDRGHGIDTAGCDVVEPPAGGGQTPKAGGGVVLFTPAGEPVLSVGEISFLAADRSSGLIPADRIQADRFDRVLCCG